MLAIAPPPVRDFETIGVPLFVRVAFNGPKALLTVGDLHDDPYVLPIVLVDRIALQIEASQLDWPGALVVMGKEKTRVFGLGDELVTTKRTANRHLYSQKLGGLLQAKGRKASAPGKLPALSPFHVQTNPRTFIVLPDFARSLCEVRLGNEAKGLPQAYIGNRGRRKHRSHWQNQGIKGRLIHDAGLLDRSASLKQTHRVLGDRSELAVEHQREVVQTEPILHSTNFFALLAP